MSDDDHDFYDELTTLYCHNIIAEAAGWELTTEELNQVYVILTFQ